MIFSAFYELFYQRADPRIRDFPFMGNPVPIFLFYGSYAIFFTYFMPQIMRNRRSIDVKKFVLLFHIVLFFISATILMKSLKFVPFMSWRCEPLGLNNFGDDLEIVHGCYFFLLTKFIYTIESILVGLKKNLQSSETYLIIHHTSLPLAVWSVINFYPGGHAIFIGFINSFCHTILYGYRLIFCHMFPNTRLYKKRQSITLGIFVIQFVAIFLHAFQLFISNDCNFPMGYAYLAATYITIITILAILLIIPQS